MDKDGAGWEMSMCKITIQKRRGELDKKPPGNGAQRNTKRKHTMPKMREKL